MNRPCTSLPFNLEFYKTIKLSSGQEGVSLFWPVFLRAIFSLIPNFAKVSKYHCEERSGEAIP
ncbi:MAG: hypothetical protein DRH10_03845 [Deltaproteobacteria bacterium]|nr:MAG: hypothetical protein DRH10_03845 [Deltaproteobacteria bacterium]RLB94600.1 MAG: hypothetical protein DRH50_06150 [Deltaproteobacteria bacterium]RLC11660.1 MAG: hypothetical protein DRH43_03655 [Deltaproteobacteria bacterium]